MLDQLFPLSKFLNLDEFVTPNLLRPFYLLAMGLTALFGLFGVLGGLGMMVISPLGGLVTIITSLGSTALALFGIRLGCEAFIALFRMHSRFVGGHPRDEIPD